LLNKSDFGPGLVELPDVELFVFLDCLVHLGRLEAFVGARFDDVDHFDSLGAAGQVLDDGENTVPDTSWPKNKINMKISFNFGLWKIFNCC